MHAPTNTDEVLKNALEAAPDTRYLAVDLGVRHRTASVFESLFSSQPAVVVADENTFEAAGRDVQDSFSHLGRKVASPFIFGGNINAEFSFVELLESALRPGSAIPVAVGSGTVNDITKLVAQRLKRPYLTVATAASMDGYTAFGASIEYQGSKQTFGCFAPVAVLADLEVIARSPEGMNASGYADLLAKCTAGSDWILADAAGVERIDESIWNSVQGSLRSWIASPVGVAENDPTCLRNLVNGLMISGFAMQRLRSSRPASGAEHQFSHLWDMQGHVHNGGVPSHGFKVGIGTLSSLALYEELLRLDIGDFSLDLGVNGWPPLEDFESRIAACLGGGHLGSVGRQEMSAKYVTWDDLRRQLARLRDAWPGLQGRLRRQLLSTAEARDMLRDARCPFEPEQIGLSRQRLRMSYEQAYFIRRRFTVLDFAERWGLTTWVLDRLFGPGGPWSLVPGNDAATATRAAAGPPAGV